MHMEIIKENISLKEKIQENEDFLKEKEGIIEDLQELNSRLIRIIARRFNFKVKKLKNFRRNCTNKDRLV